MAFTDVPTKNVGDSWSASDNNTYIKDNFAAGVPAIFSAAGDLAVASGNKAASRLPIGTDGQVLTVDTAQALKMKWAALSFGSLVARYTMTTNQSIANSTTTIINFNTVDYDANSIVTTGASWKCTVPSGQGCKFLVTGAIRMASSANWAANELLSLAFYKNNSISYFPATRYMQAAATYQVGVSFFGVLVLAATDFFDLRINQASGASLNIEGSATVSHIAIARLFS